MSKYKTLVKILDELRKEAPITFKKYYPFPTDTEKVNKARSLSYIHLFLKVKFGILTFDEREKFITDDNDDGGVDGYYLDKENKIKYFIQSKFRTSEDGFENVNIQLEDLLSMDLRRMVEGEKEDENGKAYNSKIQVMINELANITDEPDWKSVVILLANINDKHLRKIKRLTVFPPEIYNYKKVYEDLVFSVISGTFFDPKKEIITIKLNPQSKSNTIDYYADTSITKCKINLLFVPTEEIARILYKYKNSILIYNPRSYLQLKTGSVNKKIHSSITEIKTNEFSLYNNGITMLATDAKFSKESGRKNIASLKITSPQIINGGQTAFTLSEIYEGNIKSKLSMAIFDDKEVLLKVISLTKGNIHSLSESNKLKLIESISKATNDQTLVDEADRRANDKIQVIIQNKLFKDFGYFYERKRGEFVEGLTNGYINKSQIINRETFLRICLSINGFPSQARRASKKQIFTTEVFDQTLQHTEYISKYFFGFKVYTYLNALKITFKKDINNKFGQAQYGNGLRYGNLAMIGVVAKNYSAESFRKEKYDENVKFLTDKVLNRWKEFEEFATKQQENKAYFIESVDLETGERKLDVNFVNYYKGTTLAKNLENFFNAKGKLRKNISEFLKTSTSGKVPKKAKRKRTSHQAIISL